MNISKRDMRLLLILFGIVVFILCYFVIYDGKTRENDLLIIEISGLQNEVLKLRAVQDAVDEYNVLIAEAKEQILEAQAHYPASVLAEDLIMYMVELEKNVGISSGGISFIQPAVIMPVQALVPVDEIGEKFVLKQQNAYRVGLSVNFNLSYRQLKDLVKYVYEQSEKTSIGSVSVSFNSATGLLQGVMVINKVFIHTDAETEPLQFPEIDTGNPNPFGTIR